MSQAARVVHVCDRLYVNGVHANFVRNQAMVDIADEFLVYNPSSRGTADCLGRIQAGGKVWTDMTATLDHGGEPVRHEQPGTLF